MSGVDEQRPICIKCAGNTELKDWYELRYISPNCIVAYLTSLNMEAQYGHSIIVEDGVDIEKEVIVEVSCVSCSRKLNEYERLLAKQYFWRKYKEGKTITKTNWQTLTSPTTPIPIFLDEDDSWEDDDDWDDEDWDDY